MIVSIDYGKCVFALLESKLSGHYKALVVDLLNVMIIFQFSVMNDKGEKERNATARREVSKGVCKYSV